MVEAKDVVLAGVDGNLSNDSKQGFFPMSRKEKGDMPAGDHTGPMGRGPMTGRATGYCGGSEMAGYANPAPGRGHGMGFGRSRGFGGGGGGMGRRWRHRFYGTGLPGWLRSGWWGGLPYLGGPTPIAEREYLEGVAESLQGQLGDIKKRLDELSEGDRQKPE